MSRMNSSPRGRGSEKATSSPDLTHLDLPGLRAYRQELTQEEERVSYWRRLVQARLDVLRVANKSLDELSMTDLVKALGETGTGHRRQVFLTVNANHHLPDLPGIADVWAESVNPHDPEQVARAEEGLVTAEQALTDYRKAIHERLDIATGELITRYRVNPDAALDLLPDQQTDATQTGSRNLFGSLANGAPAA